MRGDWFRDARFGMFIHWGPYSLHGRCVWARYRERMPSSEYARYAERFRAAKYDPDDWVRMAKDAGMRYMVFCSRQHPGFSLFDTKASDFNSVKMGPKRDLVADYVEACRKGGMRVGLYYSLLDWRFPAYFAGPSGDPKGWEELLGFVRTQVRELCTNYGKIDVLWYDGRWPYKAEDWKAAELNAMVRSLQPDILINNRSGTEEDFGTPEQQLSSQAGTDRLWESCMTMNDHWAYSAADKNWKTIRQLIHILVQCVAGGGNLLLDVGPKPDGTFPPEAVSRLSKIGAWMRAHGESIYGGGACALNKIYSAALKEDTLMSKMGLTSVKGNTLYLHVFHWPGSKMVIGNLKTRAASIRMVGTGERVDFTQKEDRLLLRGLPKAPPDPYDTVIAVELEGKPEGYPDFRFIP